MTILTTQKQIKQTIAEDITYLSADKIHELRQKEGYFNEVAWSKGLYGCNGLLLQGNNSKLLYKITARTQAIYCI